MLLNIFVILNYSYDLRPNNQNFKFLTDRFPHGSSTMGDCCLNISERKYKCKISDLYRITI